MKILSALCAALAALVLLSACGLRDETPAPVRPAETAPAAAITPEGGAAILENQLGAADAATGNVMSYVYEDTVTLDGAAFHNYRVSWLVDGHASYLANYLVSVDGLVVQECPPDLAE